MATRGRVRGPSTDLGVARVDMEGLVAKQRGNTEYRMPECSHQRVGSRVRIMKHDGHIISHVHMFSIPTTYLSHRRGPRTASLGWPAILRYNTVPEGLRRVGGGAHRYKQVSSHL